MPVHPDHLHLYQMGTYPGGYNVFSVMQYVMTHWPKEMSALYEIYEDDFNAMIGWCTGFTFALSLIEDNGTPIDLDRVLHNWEHDAPFDIDGAIKEYRRYR